jgi:hypothetical protein
MRLRVIFFKDQEKWIGQCVDYDIAVQSNTIKGAQKAFSETIVGRILIAKQLGIEPFSGLGQAPKSLVDLFTQESVQIPFEAQSGSDIQYLAAVA